MNSLFYLITRSLKNRLLEILRKPGKLITYLLLVALIVGIFVLSFFTRENVEGFSDIIWLKGMIFMLTLFFLYLAIQKGLKSGDKIFDMSDVNLLFVSPVNPRSTLLYGVVKMMSMAFIAGFFILFQGNTLGVTYGIGVGGVFLIFAGFIFAICLMQILSLLIYSLTNGNFKRKRAVVIISVAVCLPTAAFAVKQAVITGANVPVVLETTLRSTVLSSLPISGWVSEGLISFLRGDMLTGFLFFGVMASFGALLMVVIILSNPDYYEDVLVASENAFERKRAIAEGRVNNEALSNKKVRVKGTGISGIGANALFRKHLRESFRVNRLGLWGVQSIITVFAMAIFSVLYRVNGFSGGIFVMLHILMWMQVFMIGTGRGLKELYTHYIYLIPEPSLLKILWANLEIIFKIFVECSVGFITAGLIMGEDPRIVAGAIIVFTFYSLLLTGINYLSLRFLDMDISAGIIVLLYMLAVLIIMLPGLIPALYVGFTVEGSGPLMALGILSLWELTAALVCFTLSKEILHKCDMPSVSIFKQR